MPSAIDRAFTALENVRKAGGDQKKVDAAVADAEKALDAAERELEEGRKTVAAKPKSAEEGAADTENAAPVEDFDYDQERLMNAPLSAGERAALNDPAYRGAAETDWFNPQGVFESPIDQALKSPKLQLSRARRI